MSFVLVEKFCAKLQCDVMALCDRANFCWTKALLWYVIDRHRCGLRRKRLWCLLQLMVVYMLLMKFVKAVGMPDSCGTIS